MEYWNAGILGLVELDLFYVDGKDQKIKSEQQPLLIPNIPFFSPIRRPVFQYSMGSRTANTTPLSEL
jgi:hypothetical protein